MVSGLKVVRLGAGLCGIALLLVASPLGLDESVLRIKRVLAQEANLPAYMDNEIPMGQEAGQAIAEDFSGTVANGDTALIGIEEELPEADVAGLMETAAAKRSLIDMNVTPQELQTLFFTAWQYALLKEAKEGFVTAPADAGLDDDDGLVRDPGIREISLGGIAYSGSDRWTIWLNGMRVTPAALPESVIDIRVSGRYVDLKWFDNYTNKIYPIRLRPQERFNLDSRIFLPGTGGL